MAKGRKKYGVRILSALAVAAMGLALTAVNASAQEYPLGMISYWKFNEGSGTIAYDSVGGNHGTLVNGPVWTIGKIGGALRFGDVDNAVNVPASPDWELGSNWTIEAWLYPTSYSLGWCSTIYSWAEMPKWFQIYMDNSGQIIITTNTEDIQTWTGQSIPLNQWSHLSAVSHDGLVTVYINLQSAGSKYATYPTGSSSIQFGGLTGPDREFFGMIDEVAIYNRALSAEEIWQHYQNGLEGRGYEIGPNPVAVAEPGLDENGLLILDGSRSYDPDGTIVSWDWVLANRDSEGNDFIFPGEIASAAVDVGIYDVTLTVTDDDGLTDTDTTVLYVPAGLGVCPELQALVDEIMETLGVTNQDQIIPAIIDLQNQLDEIDDTLTTDLGSIDTDFQNVFNDPDFAVPGDTLLEKFEALTQAVLDLNKGRKEGIYVNLGGKPGRGK